MELKEFLQLAQKDKEFMAIADKIKATWHKPGQHLNISGLSQPQKAYFIAAIKEKIAGDMNGEEPTVCIVVADELQLREMQQLLQPLMPKLQVFRPREINLFSVDASSHKHEQERMNALAMLLKGELKQIILPAEALQQRLPSPEFLLANCLPLHNQMQIKPDELQEFLLKIGYEKRYQADTQGQFSRRGDIIDVVPVNFADTYPDTGIRISFFDDVVDNFSQYSLLNQRSIGAWREEILLTPAHEVLWPDTDEDCRKLADKIDAVGKNNLQSMTANGTERKVIEALQKNLAIDVNKIAEHLSSAVMDKWLDIIYPENTTFIDYWHKIKGKKLPWIIDEPMRVNKAMDVAQAAWEVRVKEGILKGYNFTTALNAQFPRKDIFIKLDKELSILSLSIIGGSGNGFPGAEHFQIIGRESDSYKGRELQLINEIKKPGTPSAYLCTAGEVRRNKLRTLLRDEDVVDSQAVVMNLALPRGFIYPAADMWVLGEKEIFATDSKKKSKSRGKVLDLDLFSDLRPGDLVVHDQHGIGVYKGLTAIETDGVRRDYLLLAYANDDQLYLPMEALDQLQKYIGAAEQSQPKLSRLGGNDWQKLKNKARESVKKLAFDLVKLYASRAAQKGKKFPPNTTWDSEFAASFPFEETEDQLRCINEVTADMESDKIMDRLLCGDVGFGKTEVAFRAMFKCVLGGYQAALLAPTTVLAQQHYENFIRRIDGFPIKVGLLSRFANETMQKQTLRDLKSGAVDVVIGTHRILSQDVNFKKLGLVIVDEEQRFGVEHKEKLKVKYSGVDVLSLSATPIPRTLHMSLSGIRDISVIEEAPLDRRAVLTYVMEYDESLIIDAIMREFARQGQVFYLFNDTHKIAAKVKELQEALPGINVVAAHGKMSEKQLEQIIIDFVEGKIDILVCTTIIESGIDIPNVNTLIVENADRLGLAQLYQLRGRVGRSGRQAYAYITYRRDRILTEVAEKRLAAIRDFTELGSGFKIAMKDLEVRGAGNILGGEQHGQMAAIGYDMYCRMLNEEIALANVELGIENAQIPDESKQPLAETVVEIPVDAYLSKTFIADEGQRMDMYKRLTGIDSAQDYSDVIDELIDRFGDLPWEVETLADISYVRHFAAKARIERVFWQGDRFIMRLPVGKKINMEIIGAIMAQQSYQGQLNFQAGNKPLIEVRVKSNKAKEAIKELRKLFMAAEKIF